MRTLLIALLVNVAALAAGPAPLAVPLFFIPNAGQAPGSVRFLAKGSGLTAAFSPDRVAFRVAGTAIEMVFEGAEPAVPCGRPETARRAGELSARR